MRADKGETIPLYKIISWQPEKLQAELVRNLLHGGKAQFAKIRQGNTALLTFGDYFPVGAAGKSLLFIPLPDRFNFYRSQRLIGSHQR